MSEVWGVAADEFTTVTALATAVPQLVVEKAEIRSIPDLFADPGDPRDSHGSLARVAILRARKP